MVNWSIGETKAISLIEKLAASPALLFSLVAANLPTKCRVLRPRLAFDQQLQSSQAPSSHHRWHQNCLISSHGTKRGDPRHPPLKVFLGGDFSCAVKTY